MVILRTSDNKKLVVDRDVAECSVLLKNLLEDVDENEQEEIPVYNVDEEVMMKVLEWCEHHRNDPPPAADNLGAEESHDCTMELSEWDQNFIMTVEPAMIIELTVAADYLDIKSLFDIGRKTATSMISGKTYEEIWEHFNIVNDLSPEEEAQFKAQLKRENEWAEGRY